MPRGPPARKRRAGARRLVSLSPDGDFRPPTQPARPERLQRAAAVSQAASRLLAGRPPLRPRRPGERHQVYLLDLERHGGQRGAAAVSGARRLVGIPTPRCLSLMDPVERTWTSTAEVVHVPRVRAPLRLRWPPSARPAPARATRRRRWQRERECDSGSPASSARRPTPRTPSGSSRSGGSEFSSSIRRFDPARSTAVRRRWDCGTEKSGTSPLFG